jgi:hypothetical protein
MHPAYEQAEDRELAKYDSMFLDKHQVMNATLEILPHIIDDGSNRSAILPIR